MIHTWLIAGGEGRVELPSGVKGLAELIDDVVQRRLHLSLEDQIILNNILDRVITYKDLDNAPFLPLVALFIEYFPQVNDNSRKFPDYEDLLKGLVSGYIDIPTRSHPASRTALSFAEIQNELVGFYKTAISKECETVSAKLLPLLSDRSVQQVISEKAVYACRTFTLSIEAHNDRLISRLFKWAETNPQLFNRLIRAEEEGLAPIQYAVKLGSFGTVKQLFDVGPRCPNFRETVKLRMFDGKTLLCVAAQSSSNKAGLVIRELFNRWPRSNIIEENISVFSPDNFGNSPLHFASTCPHDGRIEILFELSGRNFTHLEAITKPNRWGQTPLHKAASEGRADTIGPLFVAWEKYGVNLDLLIQPDQFGATPLHWISSNRFVNTFIPTLFANWPKDRVQLLLQPNKKGQTALHLTAENGCAMNIDQLVKHWPPQHHSLLIQCDLDGGTPLHYWARGYGYESELRQLLESWSSISQPIEALLTQDNDGRTALHYAIFFNNSGAVDLILTNFSKQHLEMLFKRDNKGFVPYSSNPINKGRIHGRIRQHFEAIGLGHLLVS